MKLNVPETTGPKKEITKEDEMAMEKALKIAQERIKRRAKQKQG